MDTKTLEALKGSIAKWTGVVAGTTEDRGDQNFPLCKAFRGCYGCPVAERTEQENCDGSPYYDFDDPEIERDSEDTFVRYIHTDESRAAAQAELDFLKSLLPAGA